MKNVKKKLLTMMFLLVGASLLLIGCKKTKTNESTKKQTATTESVDLEEQQKEADESTIKGDIDPYINDSKKSVVEYQNSTIDLFSYSGVISYNAYKNRTYVGNFQWTVPNDTEDKKDNIVKCLDNLYGSHKQTKINKLSKNMSYVWNVSKTHKNLQTIICSYDFNVIAVNGYGVQYGSSVFDAENPKMDAYAAYKIATSLALKDLEKKDDGYYYDNKLRLVTDDVNKIEKDGEIPSDVVFNKLCYLIEGTGIGYNNWDEWKDYVFDPAPENDQVFKNKISRIKKDFPTYQHHLKLAKKFNKLKSVKGTLELDEGLIADYQFTISNLSKCAKEMGISQEMLGYILADFDYAYSDIQFNENKTQCSITHNNDEMFE